MMISSGKEKITYLKRQYSKGMFGIKAFQWARIPR